MNPVYENLFDTYCEAILKQLRSFPGGEISDFLETLPVDRERRIDFYDQARQFYTQWSIEAFVIGLHLGLSLLDDQIRRPRPQEGQ